MNQQAKRFKAILIGDTCLDIYQWGIVDRISPEAPVPIFVPKKTETLAGMAANVSKNLKKFNIEVVEYFGIESKKTRLVDLRSKQQIVRIDHDEISQPIKLPQNWTKDVDVVVVSDYNKGAVTYELLERITNNTTIPIFVDTKKTDLARLGNCYIKINESEWNKKISSHPNLIVTLGENGAMFKQKTFSATNVEVVDVCGAGDTFLAALTFKFLHTNNIEESIKFAVSAATVTVQHTGNYAPSLEEI